MAIEDLAVMIVGEAALVFATLVLARNTERLHKSTNVLAQIERRRDSRQTLHDRIELAESLTDLEPIWIDEYLGAASGRSMGHTGDVAKAIRELRPLLPKTGDPDLPDLVQNLDFLIRQLDNADAGAGISAELEKGVSKAVENMKGRLKNLLPRWRKELEALYGE
jgi:hypothetical protein